MMNRRTKKKNTIFWCPTGPDVDRGPVGINNEIWVNYQINSHASSLFHETSPPNGPCCTDTYFKPARWTQFDNPATAITIPDATGSWIWGDYPEQWTGVEVGAAQGARFRHMSDPYGYANMLFGDGHVGSVECGDVTVDMRVPPGRLTLP